MTTPHRHIEKNCRIGASFQNLSPPGGVRFGNGSRRSCYIFLGNEHRFTNDFDPVSGVTHVNQDRKIYQGLIPFHTIPIFADPSCHLHPAPLWHMAASDLVALGRSGATNVETGSARARSLTFQSAQPQTNKGILDDLGSAQGPWESLMYWLYIPLWPATCNIMQSSTNWTVWNLSITPKPCLHLNRRDPRCPPSPASPEAVGWKPHKMPRRTNRENRVVQPQRSVLRRTDQTCSSIHQRLLSYQRLPKPKSLMIGGSIGK